MLLTEIVQFNQNRTFIGPRTLLLVADLIQSGPRPLARGCSQCSTNTRNLFTTTGQSNLTEAAAMTPCTRQATYTAHADHPSTSAASSEVWSKRGNINTAALITIAQCNTLVARCSRQIIGPADWVFVTLGLLRCD